MVGPEEVDGELEIEVREEMVKYGQVANVVVYQVVISKSFLCHVGSVVWGAGL